MTHAVPRPKARNASSARRQSADHRPKATAAEVAAFLQVPLKTLYDWRLKRQGPPGVRVGKHLRFDWTDVEAWWDSQKAQQN